jgi:hypothetical protein
MKSAKIMSIMVVSLVMGGKRRNLMEYIIAMIITIGIILFNLGV